jgi:hypothetical protein
MRGASAVGQVYTARAGAGGSYYGFADSPSNGDDYEGMYSSLGGDFMSDFMSGGGGGMPGMGDLEGMMGMVGTGLNMFGVESAADKDARKEREAGRKEAKYDRAERARADNLQWEREQLAASTQLELTRMETLANIGMSQSKGAQAANMKKVYMAGGAVALLLIVGVAVRGRRK